MTYKKHTILLVEDEIITGMSEKLFLENQGYKVIHITSAEKALRIVSEKIYHVDIILMDVDLGKNKMDGIKAAKQMKYESIPIIFLTSHPEEEIIRRMQGLFYSGYVEKCCIEADLTKLINSVLVSK